MNQPLLPLLEALEQSLKEEDTERALALAQTLEAEVERLKGLDTPVSQELIGRLQAIIEKGILLQQQSHAEIGRVQQAADLLGRQEA